MSAPIFPVLGLSVIFSVISSILMIVAVSTDYWEITTFSTAKLQQLDKIILDKCYLSEANHFFKLVLEHYEGNTTDKTYYLRDMYGGIWRVCDTVPGKFTSSCIIGLKYLQSYLCTRTPHVGSSACNKGLFASVCWNRYGGKCVCAMLH